MIIQPNSSHCDTQLIFHPSHLGLVWGLLDQDGSWFPPDPWSPTGENVVLANIIESMKRGVYTKAGYNLRCVPNIRKKIGKVSKKKGKPSKSKVLSLVAKSSDCTSLGELFAAKRDRGNQVGLRTISERNRYKGKVDWESNRGQIATWVRQGLSLGKIARRLNVSPSTLSEANKRHGLYTPKTPVA